MKAEELKRLNLVKTKQGIFYIWAVGKFDVMICPFLEEEPFQISLSEIEPIELTKEWLIKFGLRRNKEAEISTYQRWEQPEGDNIGLYFFTFFKNGIGQWILRLVFPESKGGLYSPGMNKLMYVHQLQNLYFCLTGQELTIKE